MIIPFGYEQQKIVTDGLILNLDAGNVSSYPESGSTWTDLSNSQYNSNIYNGSSYVNNFLTVNGSTSYIDSGVSTVNSNSISYSIGGWCKIIDNSIANRIYGRGANNWSITITWLKSSGVITFGVVTTNPTTSAYYCSTTTTYSVGQVIHIMAIWDCVNKLLLIYINGLFNNSLSLSSNILRAPSTGGWVVGTAGDYYPASVSTFNVYNRVLTAAEVSQNFNVLRGRYGI
jgi:hypothetical protein